MKNIFKLSLVALLICSMNACTSTDTEATEKEKVEKVETLTLKQDTISRILTFSGVLEGYEQMNISPSITGHIEKIYVEVGSRVSAGQQLIRMEQTQYNTSKITLASTKTELDRVTALKASGSASQQSYDQLKAQYDQLKENLEFIEANTYVKAQFAGVISAKNFENGEMYTGAPILTLTQVQTLKTYINIPETYYPMVQKGMPLEIKSEIYPEQTFVGNIEIVYPTIDPNTHTFKVKVKIPNAKELLRPGMYVTSNLGLGKAQTILAPYSAVMKLIGSNERYVFVNDNGKAKRIGITMGQRFNEYVEIISDDIEEGMDLIITGQERLVDGVKLDVVTSPSKKDIKNE